MILNDDCHKEDISVSSQVDSNLTTLPYQTTGCAEPDDLYPGSFFRIPGIPSPGNTAWSLSE
jgi:hypothetical protein